MITTPGHLWDKPKMFQFQPFQGASVTAVWDQQWHPYFEGCPYVTGFAVIPGTIGVLFLIDVRNFVLSNTLFHIVTMLFLTDKHDSHYFSEFLCELVARKLFFFIDIWKTNIQECWFLHKIFFPYHVAILFFLQCFQLFLIFPTERQICQCRFQRRVIVIRCVLFFFTKYISLCIRFYETVTRHFCT